MKALRKTIKIASLSAGLALALLCAHTAAAQKIVANIDASQTSAPVSNYIFGMFIEHIGKTMYGPLWAEMIDDRKFYFPIASKDAETGERHDFPGMQVRKWRPVGGDNVVTMDKEKPFAGEQSPRIALDAKAPHGIRQSGIALVKGKRYTGRIVVKASPGAHIAVSLAWGQGTSDRQTINLAPLAATYKTIPLSFVAQADASDAAIEITGTGPWQFSAGRHLADAGRQHSRLSARHDCAAERDQIGILALRRQLHLELHLVQRRWRSRRAAARVGLCMESDADQRSRHG